MKIDSYKELIVWQKSMELTKDIYAVKFPPEEMYGLQSQIRRAAVSIPSNIAEGHRRKTKADFLQFLHIADGSAAELETQLLLTSSVYPHLSLKKSFGLLQEVQKMLTVMIRRLRASSIR